MVAKMKIAVLLPCYEPGGDIDTTLDSLRTQTVPFKLFVIDDGSTRKPDYQSLLREFDHHLILSPRNLGVNEARNPALKQILSEGYEYIALIDCGDICMPHRLAVQQAYLDANRHIAIVGSNIDLVHGSGQNKVVLKFPETPSGVKQAMHSVMPVSHPTLMIRADVFRTIGLYSGRFDAAEDFDMIRRADRAGFLIANLQDKLVCKIETNRSVSVRKRHRQLRSRLAIQWTYMQWLKPLAWVGLARTLILLVTPPRLAVALKEPIGRFHKATFGWMIPWI